MADEYLTVNSIVLLKPCWWIESLAALDNDADVRGEDEGLWQATGERGEPRYITGTIYPFKLWVLGDMDKDNTPYPDARQGRIDNLDYLKANLGQATATGDGTVPCIHNRYDGSTRIADAHVIGPTNTVRGTDTQKSLTISHSDLFLSVPGGLWLPP